MKAAKAQVSIAGMYVLFYQSLSGLFYSCCRCAWLAWVRDTLSSMPTTRRYPPGHGISLKIGPQEGFPSPLLASIVECFNDSSVQSGTPRIYHASRHGVRRDRPTNQPNTGGFQRPFTWRQYTTE